MPGGVILGGSHPCGTFPGSSACCSRSPSGSSTWCGTSPSSSAARPTTT